MKIPLDGVTKLNLENRLLGYVSEKNMDTVIEIIEDVILAPVDKRCQFCHNKVVITDVKNIPEA